MPDSVPQPKTVLVVSQTFVPDPASVGQHMADVAFELSRRGHRVRVYASGRGYEDSTVVYPRREMLNGAEIRRFPFASFGKKSILLRVLGTAVFQIQAFFAALFTRRLAGIFFSTSPPLIGLPLCIAAAIRRVPTAYWAMDLNPDQLIALGKLKPTDFVARLLEWANRFILHHVSLIVALDRFMAERLAARGIASERMLILPPWPHEDQIHDETAIDREQNPFRQRHNLRNKFVIMYSGNHSPSNPLTTLLDAAVRLKNDPNLMFLFVGGGNGKREVEAYIRDHQLTNALSLPYQPLSELKYSLTAADVHVVALGDPMVGIIHPCKIYGAMTAAKPVLFLGPRPSHISDLLDQHGIGLHVAHGDVAGAIAAIERLRTMPATEREAMGRTAESVLHRSLSQKYLCGRFCDATEAALGLRAEPTSSTTPPLPEAAAKP
ncbi:MAG TPA: glycosyltransferase family 4 protein [Tepidisphaeraceae bacterium]|nr:glycosyltransferase family 4 protein [Tepidisphaeraceae bacterium]